MHLRIICVLALFIGIESQAQVRKYSNEFLAIGVGASALAQSGAVAAQINGVYSSYWNPAGLNSVKTREFGLMHAEYFAGIAKFDYLAAAFPLPEDQVAAFSLVRFGVDDILNTSELIDDGGNIDYDRITLFSAADYALTLSYARMWKDKYRVGANAKVIYRNIGSFANSIGFGFDVGAQTDFGAWTVGAVVKDATSTFNAWFIDTEGLEDVFENTGNELPENDLEITAPTMKLGVARSFAFGTDFGLTTEFDLTTTFDGERNELISAGFIALSPSLGTELGYQDFAFLRLGVGNFQNETDFDDSEYLSFQPNLGLGIAYKNVRIDYAITDIGDQSTALYSNIFSLTLAL